MINKNYSLSLKLFIKLQSIDYLLLFCPLSKSKIPNQFDRNFHPVVNAVLQRAGCSLAISTKNVEVSKTNLDLLSIATKRMIDNVDTELKNEKKVNVVSSLEVLKNELEDLLKLL